MSNVMEFYGFQFSTKTHASPELSNAQKCFKGTLFLVNLLFLIFGCVLAAVGSYALSGNVNALAGVTLPRGLIVIGVFIIILSFVGCLAAWKESRIFLGLYFVFLLIFTIILFAVGIAVYVKKDKSAQYMSEGWRGLTDVDPVAGNDIRVALQNQLGCCGLSGYNDTYRGVPCPSLVASPLSAQPCLPLLDDIFQKNVVTAGGCGIAFSIIMIFGMILVCVLMEGIKKKKHMEDIRKLHKKIKENKDSNEADTTVNPETVTITAAPLPPQAPSRPAPPKTPAADDQV